VVVRGWVPFSDRKNPGDPQVFRPAPEARNLEKYFKTGSGIATLRKRILTSEVRRT